MYFAEIVNGVVGYVGGGEDYTILPPNCFEIMTVDAVRPGMIHDNGYFREPSAVEVNAPYLSAFRADRAKFFADTSWVRERHADKIAMIIDDTVEYDLWLKYWQTLRDIPQHLNFDPKHITWPTQPE